MMFAIFYGTISLARALSRCEDEKWLRELYSICRHPLAFARTPIWHVSVTGLRLRRYLIAICHRCWLRRFMKEKRNKNFYGFSLFFINLKKCRWVNLIKNFNKFRFQVTRKNCASTLPALIYNTREKFSLLKIYIFHCKLHRVKFIYQVFHVIYMLSVSTDFSSRSTFNWLAFQ